VSAASELALSVAGRRVVVADDDVLVRAGIVSLLTEAGYDVVGEAADGAHLAEIVAELTPDLAVIDIRMPPTHTWEGIDIARSIRRAAPDVGILLLSAYVELETAIDLLEGGERIGYLLKSRITRPGDLPEALERIAAGGSVIDSALVSELFAQKRRTDPLEVLSDRERTVLALVAEGRSNSSVAQELSVSEGAVEKHVRSILAKLDLPESRGHHRRVLAVLTYLSNS
jgi:DNA-binding NarL/FixJ family response regulator